MKVLCFTDSLNSGGAQRQLCMLAVLLKRAGHDVEFLTYFDYNFYQSILDNASIPHTRVSSGSKLGRILSVRRIIRQIHPKVVIAYLDTPNFIAELAGLPQRDFALIVSERSSDQRQTFSTQRRFFFHRFADAVVCNSFTQAKFVGEAAPFLAGRITTIINCVDLEAFKVKSPAGDASSNINLVVLARFQAEKNPMGLVQAMKMVCQKKPKQAIVVNWYGNNFFADDKPTKDSMLFLEVNQAIRDNGLENNFHVHTPVLDTVPIYQSASALCLPSFYEGCSNVICEAIACGKPVLASNVCDNSILVREGENGFLFNSHSPENIAEVILKFADLPVEKQRNMEIVSRRIAEEKLSENTFLVKHLQLFDRILPR
jgi:glycosyltransferase involved in cell wall biosynthesis